MHRDLLTRWGRALDPERVLPEHPRPQLVRESYLNLNGWWDYAITDGADPQEYDGRILVPFSPEAPLSGVHRQLQPHELLVYRRALSLPAGLVAPGRRVLLHLGAVDQTCEVLLNGREVASGEGGYWPVTADLTDALHDDANELVVRVRDRSERHQHASGKQRLAHGGIWYTAQSGIWQTVWLEAVPELHVERLTLTPLLEQGCVEVTVHASHGTARVDVGGRGTELKTNTPTRIAIDDVRPWTPEDPHLYDVEVTLGDDRVTSYVAMRSVGTATGPDGTTRLTLNGAPYAHVGVLDQGYWPDGLMTAPSDEAMVHDIATMKRLGFTMLRKHVKVEPLRWYHHCDRLGMLVWQDLVNGGGRYRTAAVTWPGRAPIRLDDTRWGGPMGRADPAGRALFRSELHRTVELLRNSPSVVLWVAFNEGWGQFDAVEIAAELGRTDPTRLVDHASGWHDQGAGHLHSLHVYGRELRPPRSSNGRALALTEYGGHQLRVDGHVWDDETSHGYGEESTREGLAEQFRHLHEQLAPHRLAATVYTQLSDVETETNGLLTYDREVLKIDEEVVRTSLDVLRRAAGA